MTHAHRPFGVIVSIHDVSPRWFPEVQALWMRCRQHGVTPALLVVPDWHGAWPMEAAPDFLAWLQACARDGAEILLHGERHDEVGRPRMWCDHLRAWGRTAAEGECLTLRADAARALVARGRARLQAIGLRPVGFVPPAWLARQDTHQMVGACGLWMSEDVRCVYAHDAPCTIRTPVLRWSGRSVWRAWGSRGVAQWRWWMRGRTPVLRIALHPQDLQHPVTDASLAHDLARWTAARPVMTYRDLLHAARDTRSLATGHAS